MRLSLAFAKLNPGGVKANFPIREVLGIGQKSTRLARSKRKELAREAVKSLGTNGIIAFLVPAKVQAKYSLQSQIKICTEISSAKRDSPHLIEIETLNKR